MSLDALNTKIQDAHSKYYRLILVASLYEKAKTKLLKEAGQSFGYPYINLSLALSEQMVDIPVKKRSSQIITLLPKLIRDQAENVLFLDNIELLFLPELGIDPLKALQSVATKP